MAWRGRHWPRALHTVSFNPHQGSATVITGTLSVCSTVNWQKPFERGRVVVRRVHRTLTPQKISIYGFFYRNNCPIVQKCIYCDCCSIKITPNQQQL